MLKETVICVIIVASIFSLDMFTQNYTNKITKDITKIFAELKELAIEENKDKIDKKITELDEMWNKKHDKLACYIEHDELEKVETDFVTCKSYMESKQYDMANAELEKTIFVLEHISDKYSFNFENIF